MNTDCDVQTTFSFRDDREIRFDFEGGQITSNAGLIALREFDHRIGFTQGVVACLHDDRHPSYVRHDLSQLLIQRLYGILRSLHDRPLLSRYSIAVDVCRSGSLVRMGIVGDCQGRRANAGFAVPKLHEFCERHKIGFTIATGGNEVFKRQAQPLLEEAIAQYNIIGEKATIFGHFAHRASTWPWHLRVLVKVECVPEGTNTRFVVTNRPGEPRRLFHFYEGRGQAENYIRELENQFKADRLSCPRFEANAFRLVLFALAYQLINLFRSCLGDPALRKA